MDATQVSPASEATDGPAGRPPARRRLLGDLLIREGLITRAQLDEALRAQARADEPRPLGEILVDRGVITQGQLNFVLDRYHKKYRLGDLLVETNAITEEQLELALAHQKQTDLRLGDILLKLHFLTEQEMRQALCKQLRVRFIDLDTAVLDQGLAALIPSAYARQHRVLPLRRAEDRLTVAMDDPGDLDVVEALEGSTGCRIDVVTSTHAAFQRAFDRLYPEEIESPAAPAAAGPEPPASAAGDAVGDALRRERDEGARRLRELETRHAETVRALTELQTAHGALRRDWETTAEALRDLSERHADMTMRLNKLVSEYAALRDAHEGTSRALRDERQRYEALLRDRRTGGDDFDAVLRQLSPNPPPRRRPRGR
ncbi:MAG: hypothetical protein HY359_03275 [Candidatus Rokubacteria bacterium]|nr:hypothetical protein [Candidatus Rokubacteria bacterium]